MSDDVAGVDGCRTGWVVATRTGAHIEPSFATIVSEFALIGVDMPVGLPDDWHRDADRAARAYVAPRGACVFPTPPRSLVHHTVYADANADSRTRYGRGVTRQTFHLFPKIRDVDAAIDAAMQHRVAEVHPECSFRALTGTVLEPKRTADGQARRRRALESVFGPIDTRLPGARPDDVLDAYVVLWTALHHRDGRATVLGDGAVDARGLVMRIVV